MDGNQRYSWTKKKRSPLVSRTLPRLFRCNTISCCRSVAISASSRAFDLNGETKMARTNQRSPITRSAYAICSPSQRDEVFGTQGYHRLQRLGRARRALHQPVIPEIKPRAPVLEEIFCCVTGIGKFFS